MPILAPNGGFVRIKSALSTKLYKSLSGDKISKEFLLNTAELPWLIISVVANAISAISLSLSTPIRRMLVSSIQSTDLAYVYASVKKPPVPQAGSIITL